jgi:hypothetical protein
MASATIIFDDCSATRCDLCLHKRVQFIFGQRPSGYFYRRLEDLRILRAGVIKYREYYFIGVRHSASSAVFFPVIGGLVIVWLAGSAILIGRLKKNIARSNRSKLVFLEWS